MSDHSHTCCVPGCGHTWDCPYTLEQCKRKETLKAVQVNAGGPYCEMCRNLTMGVRIAANRGIDSDQALQRVKRNEILKAVFTPLHRTTP